MKLTTNQVLEGSIVPIYHTDKSINPLLMSHLLFNNNV
jgi:hypothetical protein